VLAMVGTLRFAHPTLHNACGMCCAVFQVTGLVSRTRRGMK